MTVDWYVDENNILHLRAYEPGWMSYVHTSVPPGVSAEELRDIRIALEKQVKELRMSQPVEQLWQELETIKQQMLNDLQYFAGQRVPVWQVGGDLPPNIFNRQLQKPTAGPPHDATQDALQRPRKRRMSKDEVLDLHNELTRFDGDFRTVFNMPEKT